ncbi:MAG: hypothetical protein ABJD07_07140 [Gemmatimonadaceae bacterium]
MTVDRFRAALLCACAAIGTASCNGYGTKGGGLGGRAGPAYVTAKALDFPPCTVAAGDRKDDWREIDAAGFRFCVPGHWHQVDAVNFIPPAGAWEGAGGVIRWTILGADADVSYPRVQWERADLRTQHRYYETIGGQRARMWDDQIQGGGRLTRAVWDASGVVMEGSGPSIAAGMHLRIYKTVRFDKTEKR